MDAAMVVALGGIASIIGGAVWKIIERIDKKRDKRETEARAVYEKLLKAAEEEIDKLSRQVKLMRQDGNDWKEQVVILGGKPVPTRWRDLEETL